MRRIMLVGLLVTTTTAAADEPARQPAAAGWTVTPALGTDFPLDVGIGVHVETPFRLRFSTSLGVLTGAYVDVINAFLVGIDAYNDDTATLIKSSLSTSLVWRTHAGFRLFRNHGFYTMVGYTFVGLGGGATGSQILEAATGRQLPATDGGMQRSFTVTSKLHMLDVELGWRWVLPHRIELLAALGGVFTVASKTTITPDYTPRAPTLTKEFTDYGASYLDDIYTSYVFSPVITVVAGYTF